MSMVNKRVSRPRCCVVAGVESEGGAGGGEEQSSDRGPADLGVGAAAAAERVHPQQQEVVQPQSPR